MRGAGRAVAAALALGIVLGAVAGRWVGWVERVNLARELRDCGRVVAGYAGRED